jgi:hypothetical protein
LKFNITNNDIRLKVLFVCWYPNNPIPSVKEFVDYFKNASANNVDVLNIFDYSIPSPNTSIPYFFNINFYDVLIIHNTISYDVDNLLSLDKLLTSKIKNFKGVKIIFKQDEHFKFNKFRKYVDDVGFDLIYTTLNPSYAKKLFAFTLKSKNINFKQMLTSYISDSMLDFANRKQKKYTNRSIDIGYRGSVMPLEFGRACYEKKIIGEDVDLLLRGKNLKTNISNSWSDRFSNNQWYEFISDCKSVLAVESGSSIYDLDGSLSKKIKLLNRKFDNFSNIKDFENYFIQELKEYDLGNKVLTISPRHFEAAACKSLQIMFPGHYGGIFKPYVHYLPLNRDYSNLDDIVNKLKNQNYIKKITDHAFEEIVCNEKYHLKSFVVDIDKATFSCYRKKVDLNNKFIHYNNSKDHNVLILQYDDYGLDPRRDSWIPNGEKKINIHHLIISTSISKENIKYIGSRVIFSSPSIKFDLKKNIHISCDPVLRNDFIFNKLMYIASLRDLDYDQFALVFGLPLNTNSNRVLFFRNGIEKLLNDTFSALNAFDRVNGCNVIIAINLPTLLAAYIIKRKYKVKIVFEALEFWTEADNDFHPNEKKFYKDIEEYLLKHCDFCHTVSKGLAETFKENYSKEFDYSFNAVPLTTKRTISNTEIQESHILKFIFQGTFARNRYLEELITAFSSPKVKSKLYLRGKNNLYKLELINLAKSLNVLDSKVFFLKPVNVDKLVTALDRFDFGIIPYGSNSINYQFCSPNKLGEYFASGLAILANTTEHVKNQIIKSKSGSFTDFRNIQDLINELCRLQNFPYYKINIMRKNSYRYFKNFYNWETQSKKLYDHILKFFNNSYKTKYLINKNNEKFNFKSKLIFNIFVLKKIYNNLPLPSFMKLVIRNLYSYRFFLIKLLNISKIYLFFKKIFNALPFNKFFKTKVTYLYYLFIRILK